MGMTILNIAAPHVLALVTPEPRPRDPFDRLLLAQCAVENLRLVTVDRALVDHPLAFRPT
jgi:PIN domain nuclease of toxin-antitoxin system